MDFLVLLNTLMSLKIKVKIDNLSALGYIYIDNQLSPMSVFSFYISLIENIVLNTISNLKL